MPTETEEQGVVDVRGESLRYAIRVVDARSSQQREQDAQRGRPGGEIMVLVPGHGQGVHGPKKLLATAAQLSRSRIAWCIDPVPAKGGDRVEGRAIARIVRDRISTTFPAAESPMAATLIGWSHGGAEGLRAAESAPDLFPQFLGLCPTGLVDRPPRELVRSFFLEATRTLLASVRRRDWTCLRDALRLGANAATGMAHDLGRTRSARRLLEDIGWAGKKVSGGAFEYPGDVVLLFGSQDTVVRWQDAFPECARPEQIPSALTAYGQNAFPRATRVEVQVVEGAHVAPEVDAPTFLRAGLGLLGQLDTNAEEKHC